MASVYRRRGSQFWTARFKTSDGVWKARTTKESIKAKALGLAFELEGAGSTIRTENATAVQIDRVVRSMWERHTGKLMSLNRIDEYLRNWLKNLKRKPGTLVKYTQIIEEFIKFLGDHATYDLKVVETAHVQAYVNYSQEKGRSGSTVVVNTKILNAVFATAIRAGLIERNPVAAVHLPDVIKEERTSFTAGEVKSILEAAKHDLDWCTAILLAAFNGLRLGDATNLKWEAIDLLTGVLTFVPEKTSRKGKELTVPLSENLLKHLEKLASSELAQNSEFLCPTLAGRKIGGRAGLSAEFIELMNKAKVGLGSVKPKDGRDRKFNQKTFHSLRHTFVSRLANNGVSGDIRTSLAGHANVKETVRYTHLDMKIKREAINLK